MPPGRRRTRAARDAARARRARDRSAAARTEPPRRPPAVTGMSAGRARDAIPFVHADVARRSPLRSTGFEVKEPMSTTTRWLRLATLEDGDAELMLARDGSDYRHREAVLFYLRRAFDGRTRAAQALGSDEDEAPDFAVRRVSLHDGAEAVNERFDASETSASEPGAEVVVHAACSAPALALAERKCLDAARLKRDWGGDQPQSVGAQVWATCRLVPRSFNGNPCGMRQSPCSLASPGLTDASPSASRRPGR